MYVYVCSSAQQPTRHLCLGGCSKQRSSAIQAVSGQDGAGHRHMPPQRCPGCRQHASGRAVRLRAPSASDAIQGSPAVCLGRDLQVLALDRTCRCYTARVGNRAHPAIPQCHARGRPSLLLPGKRKQHITNSKLERAVYKYSDTCDGKLLLTTCPYTCELIFNSVWRYTMEHDEIGYPVHLELIVSLRRHLSITFNGVLFSLFQITCGGFWQAESGWSIMETTEIANAHTSRAGNTTKHMTAANRVDSPTDLRLSYNSKKHTNMPQLLVKKLEATQAQARWPPSKCQVWRQSRGHPPPARAHL